MTDDPDTTPDTEIVSGEAPDDPNGEWLTYPEAVARTGRTERSVRRDAAAQLYQTRQVKGRTQLWFPSVSGSVPETIPDAPNGALAVLDRQQALIDHLSDLARQQTEPLRAMIDAREDLIRELVRQNARLKAELERLTTPDAPPDPRPWWQRWFRS